MNKRIYQAVGITLAICILGFLGYKYTFNLYNQTEESTYDPFKNVTYPAISVIEECNKFETKQFAFYQDQPKNFEVNNKFGLYIYAERQDYFEKAAELVNSNGGSWGYVLIPYNVKDRDTKKWRRVFEDLNRLKLIPVIQLWDVDLENFEKQTKGSANFLDSFDWPIKQRYISVYNEVNDSKFWYGKIDPTGYAKVLSYTIDKFKQEDPDFQIMNGAFNVSAGNTKETVDSFYYMKKMNDAVPGIFNKLDAWAAHPYPQPNFSGDPRSTGRWSIKAYDEELDFLKKYLGLNKELPVFITETGWAHQDGITRSRPFLSEQKAAENYKIAFEEVWLKDPKVRAVMPFTIKYDEPFDHFSWIKNSDGENYLQFDLIKTIPKIAGTPPNLVKGSYKVPDCGNK